MKEIFDTTPFAYVGNNDNYEELSKEELDKLKENKAKVTTDDVTDTNVEIEPLPASDEVEESSAAVVGPMLGGTPTSNPYEEPSIENALADVNEDSELLRESLNDFVNGGETYFEAAGFIEKLKNKFKKDDVTGTKKIEYGKVMKAAKAYTEMKMASSRIKIAVTKDSKVKNTNEYKELQKKAITAEKEYRKLKKDLEKEELNALSQYIEGFDSTFNKKIEKYVSDIKESKKVSIKKESVEAECGTTDIVTEKDIDSDMKPLIDKLHKKGYKTKASSSGHKNVIIKKDTDKDNVVDGHHYGDARLVFDGKYNLGKAPKYWYWKKVENDDEVDYLDVMRISGEESPNTEQKFDNWKDKYMRSLTSWIDELPDISDGKKEEKEEVEESCVEFVDDIDTQIDTLFESVLGDLELDTLDI